MAPPDNVDLYADLGNPVLDPPAGLIAKLAPQDGIVVASWDPYELLGRIHALGLVGQVDASRSVATVNWRRTSFTVIPSPQGRQQWINRPYFKFDDLVAARYQLSRHFTDKFTEQVLTVSDPQGTTASPPPAKCKTKQSSVQHISLSTESSQEVDSNSKTPQCNRVTPTGDIIATRARGTFMGNRADRIRWLICELEFERTLKVPRKYTKLFFLDEAVALAAGHRPCQTCRRSRYLKYLAAVQSAYPTRINGAPDLDKRLHAARTARRTEAAIKSLPDGVLVRLGDDEAHLLWHGALHRWTPDGYVSPIAVTDVNVDVATVLTPAPSVAALLHGYQLEAHESIGLGLNS